MHTMGWHIEARVADSALSAFTRAKPLANGQPLAGLSVLYARLGRKQEATAIARELEEWYRNHYYAPEYIAVAWANIGDLDRAFLWLEKVFEVRSSLWLEFGAGAEFRRCARTPAGPLSSGVRAVVASDDGHDHSCASTEHLALRQSPRAIPPASTHPRSQTFTPVGTSVRGPCPPFENRQHRRARAPRADSPRTTTVPPPRWSRR